MQYFVRPDEAAPHLRGVAAAALGLVHALRRQPRAPAVPRARARRAGALRQEGDRRRVPLPVRLEGARGHPQPRRLRPVAAPGGVGREPRVLRPGDRGALHPVHRRDGRRAGSIGVHVPDRQLPRGGGPRREARRPRAATRTSRRTRSRSCRCSRSGRRSWSSPTSSATTSPATRWPSTTTRPRSASSTGARTRSARRGACTIDVESLEDGAATIRDRDSMTQERAADRGHQARDPRQALRRARLAASRPRDRHSEAFDRFMASTAIDYERWHDGRRLRPRCAARARSRRGFRAEHWLLARAGSDWRDLEALLALGTPAARAAVVEQLRTGKLEQRLWAASTSVTIRRSQDDREAAVVAGLETALFYGGLSVALDLATEQRTPAMVDALFRAALRDEGEAAVHAAARLAFIHGKAKEEFDWELRPLFLRFNTPTAPSATRVFRELCTLCGVDPEPYLRWWATEGRRSGQAPAAMSRTGNMAAGVCGHGFAGDVVFRTFRSARVSWSACHRIRRDSVRVSSSWLPLWRHSRSPSHFQRPSAPTIRGAATTGRAPRIPSPSRSVTTSASLGTASSIRRSATGRSRPCSTSRRSPARAGRARSATRPSAAWRSATTPTAITAGSASPRSGRRAATSRRAPSELNDTYFNTSTYNTTAWRNLVSCQEVGHTLGLDHQDENFNNANLGTCMDYTNNPGTNQHPNQHDYDQLVTIYSHLDSTTTVGAAAPERRGHGAWNSEFGREVAGRATAATSSSFAISGPGSGSSPTCLGVARSFRARTRPGGDAGPLRFTPRATLFCATSSPAPADRPAIAQPCPPRR